MAAELRQDIEAAARRMDWNRFGGINTDSVAAKLLLAGRGVDRELEHLHEYLMGDELVDTLCVGSWGRRQGLLTLTNHRLLFLQLPRFGGPFQETFSFGEILSARCSPDDSLSISRAVGAAIVMTLRDKGEVHFKYVRERDGEDIANRIQHYVSLASRPTVSPPIGERSYACGLCGAGHTIKASDTDMTCRVCGVVNSWRHCPRCDGLLGLGYDFTIPTNRWRCYHCGRETFREFFPVAYFEEFDQLISESESCKGYGIRYNECHADPDRRRIDGTAVWLEGWPNVENPGCTVLFDHDLVEFDLDILKEPLYLKYSDITRLEVGGRGEFTTTSGGGWVGGGYGVGFTGAAKGVAEGVAMAAVLNALTTRTTNHVETIVYFAWNSGSVAVLNKVLPPDVWSALLDPVYRRIKEAQRPTQQLDLEKACPYCAETIKAAAIKCRYCGSDVGSTVEGKP